MKKFLITSTVSLGAMAMSYVYAQSFMGMLATSIAFAGGALQTTYGLAMGLVGLSAFPYILIGLATAYACYYIIKGAINLYNNIKAYIMSWITSFGDEDYRAVSAYKPYQVAIAAIVLGLVAAVACKIFFAAMVLQAAAFIPALIATAASYAVVSAIIAGINTVLSLPILPTVLAYMTVGATSAYITKSFLDWCLGNEPAADTVVIDTRVDTTTRNYVEARAIMSLNDAQLQAAERLEVTTADAANSIPVAVVVDSRGNSLSQL